MATDSAARIELGNIYVLNILHKNREIYVINISRFCLNKELQK